MAWTCKTLATELLQSTALNIQLVNSNDVLIINMNDYGDLQVAISLTSRQIIVETSICQVSAIVDQTAFNLFLLRHQKMLPLSSTGISRLNGEEYYIVFGALSLHSSIDDIHLEIVTLAENALGLAEIAESYCA